VKALLAFQDAEMADAVVENIDAALGLIDATGAEGYRPLLLVERARLAQLMGDRVEGERGLREAHELFIRIGARGHAERLRPELSTIS
jgi:hypothetical protein